MNTVRKCVREGLGEHWMDIDVIRAYTTAVEHGT